MKTYLVTITREESCILAVRARSAKEAEDAVENASVNDLAIHWDDADWTFRAYDEVNTKNSPDYEVNEDGELVDPQ